MKLTMDYLKITAPLKLHEVHEKSELHQGQYLDLSTIGECFQGQVLDMQDRVGEVPRRAHR